ncbi:MAG: hypothetical protein QM776_02070 [Rhodocyclaceae bacterium]
MKATFFKSALAVAALAAAAQASAGPVGYGAATTGGTGGEVVNATSRDAIQNAIATLKTNPRKLIINVSGNISGDTIVLDGEVGGNNVSIIGVGNTANFTTGIKLKNGASNVIIRNLTIHHVNTGDKDGIGIEGTSSNIWIDHNTLYSSLDVDKDYYDGLADTKKGADKVTISYNYFHDHHKASLHGYSDSDNTTRNITLHHNRWENIGSRTPLQRFGKAHIYNNYYNNITTSGINIRMGGVALIENNYFENAKNPVTSRDSSSIGYWELKGNYVGSGITWDTPDSATVNATNWTTTKSYGSVGYSYSLDAASCVKSVVIATAGAGKNLAESASCTVTSSSSSAASSVASSSSSSKASSSVASSSSSSKASSSAASSAASSSGSGPVLTGTGDYPDGFSKCANLGETCSVAKGTGWVAFGRKGKWVTKKVTVGSSIACTVAAFGSDPGGNPNKCSTQN